MCFENLAFFCEVMQFKAELKKHLELLIYEIKNSANIKNNNENDTDMTNINTTNNDLHNNTNNNNINNDIINNECEIKTNIDISGDNTTSGGSVTGSSNHSHHNNGTNSIEINIGCVNVNTNNSNNNNKNSMIFNTNNIGTINNIDININEQEIESGILIYLILDYYHQFVLNYNLIKMFFYHQYHIMNTIFQISLFASIIVEVYW